MQKASFSSSVQFEIICPINVSGRVSLPCRARKPSKPPYLRGFVGMRTEGRMVRIAASAPQIVTAFLRECRQFQQSIKSVFHHRNFSAPRYFTWVA
jgi:hypothetical protein